MRIRAELWLGLPTLLLLVAVGCSAPPPAAKKRPPPLVKAAAPEVRDVDVTLSYTVEIKPIEQAELQSKVTGYVKSIAVDKGDPVRRGQVLATIRPSDLPSQLSQAREQAGQAAAQFKLESENAGRSRKLFERGLISKAELDQAEARLAVARAALGASKAGLGAVGARLSETTIVAPFDGWITRRYVDTGALVVPSPTALQAILQVMRMDRVRVFVNVLERDVAQVRRGLPVQVTVDALAGRTFEGTVTRYSPALDPATRTLEAEIVIPNPEEKIGNDHTDRPLKPGMYGHAALRTATHPHAIVMPIEAVVTEDDKRAVFVVEDVKPGPQPGRELGRARRVPVKIGFDGGSWLEIASGLTGNELVIVQGIELVSDGSPVTVLRLTGEQNAGANPPAPPVKAVAPVPPVAEEKR